MMATDGPAQGSNKNLLALARWQWMAQREDPTKISRPRRDGNGWPSTRINNKLIGLGAMAENQKSNSWDRRDGSAKIQQ
jgi:hypothetical protein